MSNTRPPTPAALKRANQRQRLLEALRQGSTRRRACALAGISEDTLARWQRENADFAGAVIKAENQAELTFVKTLLKAAKRGDVRAAKFWLERRRPQEWGVSQAVRALVSKEIEGMLLSLRLNLTAEEYERVLSVIAESGGSTHSA